MQNSKLPLSLWARNISPSPTLAVDAKAKALKAAGEDVCGFGAGEPDFDTPEFIKEAAIKALHEGKTKYAPAAGIPDLRWALAEKYRNENGITRAEPKNVVVSPGGKFSCYLAIRATCSPGDEVVVPAPYWVSYPEMIKLAGGTPVYVMAGIEQGFKITPEQLREVLTPKTRMVILNSPSNPTGAVYTRKEMEALFEVCLSHGVWILADEIYEYLLYDDVTHHSIASFGPDAAESTITVAGFSKTFSMTGWRLGTMVAPDEVAKAVSSLQSQTSSNATTFAQYGALAALQNPDAARAAIKEMLVVFDRRRKKLFQGLKEISGVECSLAQGAFYLFPKINPDWGLTSTKFATELLEKEKVAVVSGEGFGADGYLRLSYATSDEVIEKGLERMKAYCAKL
ncbi:MAG: pyridoxal phosphate-dependent aminotransferase [Opitutales bacterium]|nr:pyridoxal phosphate-dependent aminotransferase [Opitutales bacterium]MCH8539231.1 pyridoxal phosphate-dependent aminotransferase [Opitutales bacterium]